MQDNKNMCAFEVANRFTEQALSCLQEIPFPKYPNDKVVVILEKDWDYQTCFTRKELNLIEDTIKSYEKASGKTRFDIAHENKLNNVMPMLAAGFLTSSPLDT